MGVVIDPNVRASTEIRDAKNKASELVNMQANNVIIILAVLPFLWKIRERA